MSSSDHKYDVFISFRGEDTRKTFTSQLHKALCKDNIETFVDYNLKRGDEVGPSLTEAISYSRISVVIFSENYANSKWCLVELAHIMECRRFYEHVVIPVFYEIEPSHVRYQEGSYKTAFARYEAEANISRNFANSLIEWKAALASAANISGWVSRTYR
nr:TMV resistance protein N-like [Cicer arietinum]